LRDDRFVVRKVAKTRLQVVATPRYLRRYGTPADIDQLQSMPYTAILDHDTGRLWPWMFAGERQMTPAAARFVCDDSEAEYQFVRSGQAIGQIVSFLVADDIASGRLVALLPELEPDPWDMYMYRPQRGPIPARLRLVFDALAEALSTP